MCQTTNMAEKYTSRVIFMMTPTQKRETKKAAKSVDISIGELIRQSLRRHMAALESPKVRNVVK